jgi:hypothetical protein
VAVGIDFPQGGNARITFTLTDAAGDESVSVVGSFNDWRPGQDQMQPDGSGGLSLTIDVAAGRDVYFRYLGEDGRWFDDTDAERLADGNCVVRLNRSESMAAEGEAGGESQQNSPATDVDVLDLRETKTAGTLPSSSR